MCVFLVLTAEGGSGGCREPWHMVRLPALGDAAEKSTKAEEAASSARGESERAEGRLSGVEETEAEPFRRQ